VELLPEEEKAYGEWNRLALANGDLGRKVADLRKSGHLPIGLLANCSALPGMLAGLQHSGATSRPLGVGLVFIDAHADYNTPETTLSGMLGGMPVALSAGLCLAQMRLKAGLDPALPQRHIVEACVRDTDPLEQDLLDRSEIQQLSVEDIRRRSEKLHQQMKRRRPEQRRTRRGNHGDIPVRKSSGPRSSAHTVRRPRPNRPVARGGLQVNCGSGRGRAAAVGEENFCRSAKILVASQSQHHHDPSLAI
jgi:hypothetical protein